MQNKKEAKRILPHSSFFPKNQRGQGISTNAIILIILGVVVLVVLILGFTMGWGKIAPWLSTSNVDTIATACETSCLMGSQYDFCTFERELKAKDLPTGEKVVKNTCQFFATEEGYEPYGVQECPGITCPEII